jgi:hypothetical protein
MQFSSTNNLESSVSTINDQFGSGSVLTSIRSKVNDSSLEVGWVGHSAHGDSIEPFISENRVGIENNCGLAKFSVETAIKRTLGQVGEDVSWRDTVDSDLVVCPLDGE